jgi:hypothetical protein
MRPTISVTQSKSSINLQARLKELSDQAVYVGIPTTTAKDRQTQLTNMINATSANSKKGREKRSRLAILAAENVNNAELLYIFSKGSPATGQPPREVIEPAIVASGNKEAISFELAEVTKAILDANPSLAKTHLRRAGMAGQNASRKWFTDGRNGWAPNAPMTVALKGSDRPGIDSGAMRKAITYVIKEDMP